MKYWLQFTGHGAEGAHREIGTGIYLNDPVSNFISEEVK